MNFRVETFLPRIEAPDGLLLGQGIQARGGLVEAEHQRAVVLHLEQTAFQAPPPGAPPRPAPRRRREARPRTGSAVDASRR